MARDPGGAGGASKPSTAEGPGLGHHGDYTNAPAGPGFGHHGDYAPAIARDAAAAASISAANTTAGAFGNKSLSRNDRLHLQAQPLNLHGGGYFKPGYMRRVPTGQESYDYRFYFLYNPYSIKTNMGANFEITPDAHDPSYNFFAGTQTVEFSVLINRQMEQKDGSPAIKLEGTLHDLEALYKVLNGDPQDLYGASGVGVAETSADVGFITPSSMTEFIFGPKLKFVGFVTGIGVEHKMFNNLMVPMLTEIGITFNRLSNVQASSTTAASQ